MPQIRGERFTASRRAAWESGESQSEGLQRLVTGKLKVRSRLKKKHPLLYSKGFARTILFFFFPPSSRMSLFPSRFSKRPSPRMDRRASVTGQRTGVPRGVGTPGQNADAARMVQDAPYPLSLATDEAAPAPWGAPRSSGAGKRYHAEMETAAPSQKTQSRKRGPPVLALKPLTIPISS